MNDDMLLSEVEWSCLRVGDIVKSLEENPVRGTINAMNDTTYGITIRWEFGTDTFLYSTAEQSAWNQVYWMGFGVEVHVNGPSITISINE